jgi:hypothetical protein
MMKRWLRRSGYLALLLLWFVIMAFPTFAFFLATKGEVQFGSQAQNHIRFFMVQEETSGGIGVEWVREARQVDNCSQTSLRYFLWEGSSAGQNVSFCQCYDPVTNTLLSTEESNCIQ